MDSNRSKGRHIHSAECNHAADPIVELGAHNRPFAEEEIAQIVAGLHRGCGPKDGRHHCTFADWARGTNFTEAFWPAMQLDIQAIAMADAELGGGRPNAMSMIMAAYAAGVHLGIAIARTGRDYDPQGYGSGLEEGRKVA
jgi:hypothetical protein